MAERALLAEHRYASQRLLYTPWRPADVDQLHALLAEADVRRYLCDDRIMPRDWVAGVIEESCSSLHRDGVGLWRLSLRAGDLEGETVGLVGFRDFFEPAQLQLMYALHPRGWGRGLATEAGRAMLELAFARLGHAQVVGATDPPNVASVRVMERLGMSPVDPGGFEPPLEGTGDALFFRIHRDEWLTRGERVLE